MIGSVRVFGCGGHGEVRWMESGEKEGGRLSVRDQGVTFKDTGDGLGKVDRGFCLIVYIHHLHVDHFSLSPGADADPSIPDWLTGQAGSQTPPIHVSHDHVRRPSLLLALLSRLHLSYG